MVRPLSFRRSSGGSPSYATFSVSSLPPALPGDLLFEDVCHHLHQISKIKPLPIEGRTTCKKDALRSKTLGHLTRLFALVRQDSPSRTQLGKILFGFLFPHVDSHRRYDMKEGKLGKTLARVLNVEVGHHPNGGWMEGEGLMRWDDASFWGEEGDERHSWDGCMGQVVGRLQRERSDDLTRTSTLTISQVDHLLNELASHSSWSSNSIRDCYPRACRRSTHSILSFLYSTLSPNASSLFTQLLLRDVSPFLHPPPTTLAMSSLLKYDQASIYKLTHWDVMDLWDRTGNLRKTHRLRGNFADALDAIDRRERGLKVGVNVEIPKCQKGRALRSSLVNFYKAGSRSAFAETKYDGERMQIHVDFSLPLGQQIKIFSKSKRDSTADRASTHAAILAAVFRSVDGCRVNSHLRNRLASSAHGPIPPMVSRTVILEAEMVPYSERKTKIEEFWKITACAGDRRAVFNRPGEDDSQEEHSDDLHLMLVFFDVLELDGEEMIYKPYATRRETLESVIRIVPGFSMLAERHEVRFSLGMQVAEQDLQLAFAQSLSAHEEGLVLKAAESKYNFSPAWVKLKRDYIPGLDDTIDLVLVGASWDKDRGRELNVSPSVFTTFFVGVHDQQSGSGSPHILVLFSISYGLDRKQIEDWNCRLQMGDSPTFVPYKSRASMETLSYSFELVPTLKPPMVLLKRPLLAEVFGAGFQKLPSCKHFALRWPRLSKIYPASGNGSKSWTEGLTSAAYRKLALADLGRVEEPVASEPASLDWDALFAVPSAGDDASHSSPVFWQGKLREESARESQEENPSAHLDGASASNAGASTPVRRVRMAGQENASPTKRKRGSDPPSSPSPVKHQPAGAERLPNARPTIKTLGSVTNIIPARQQMLPTPPPTSPAGRAAHLIQCRVSRTPRKAPALLDDSGVFLSPSMEASSQLSLLALQPLHVASTSSTTSTATLSHEGATQSISQPRTPRKRPHPSDSGVCLSPTSSSPPFLPLAPFALSARSPSFSIPASLGDLLRTSAIYIPPPHNVPFRLPPGSSPVNAQVHPKRPSDYLPAPQNLHTSLHALLATSDTLRVVLVDPDRAQGTREVSEQLRGEDHVVMLNVWCLRARAEVIAEDWRRWVVKAE